MNPSLVLAGHSHLAAFGVPDAGEDVAPDLIDLPADGSAVRAVAGALPRTEAYWTTFERAAKDATPVIVWEGTQHQDRFLIEPFPPLDFVLSLAPTLPLDPRASYVAEGQLRALFMPTIAPLRALVSQLTTGGRAVLVAGTPPPAADQDAVRIRLLADAARVAAASFAGVDLATVKLASSYTLQKLWSLLQAMVAEATAASGGTFVPVPDRLRGTDGFLPERMLADDGIHADRSYGAEMLKELAAAAASLSKTRNRQA